MGNRQENWFHEQLSYSSQRDAVWKVIGQQIVFNRLNESYPGNTDYLFDYVCPNPNDTEMRTPGMVTRVQGYSQISD